MQVLGIRFCAVTAEAEALAHFLDSLGMPRRPMDYPPSSPNDAFAGAVFPAGSSWVEVWQQGHGIQPCLMLQVVVDDADAFANHAKTNGLSPTGPMDAHGERIYFLSAPGGLKVSFQSAVK